MKKQIGLIGLGKMGGNLALNLIDQSWEVIGYNRTAEVTKKFESNGLIGTYSYKELTEHLGRPRLIWVMVSHQAVGAVLDKLIPLLSENDTIVDGGNSFFKESKKRAEKVAARGINFLDVGVSGGPRGARFGACLMIGGAENVFERYRRLFRDISIEDGYGYFGKSGAGHFVKMVHNGIEYGMMQAIAEGFAILRESNFSLDLAKVADVYNHGSVIESRLIEWLKKGFDEHGEALTDISGCAQASGEGQWTVDVAHEFGIRDKVIHEALRARQLSQTNPNYQGKIISTLRNQFGGHEVSKR